MPNLAWPLTSFSEEENISKPIQSRPSVSPHPMSQSGLEWVKTRLDHCMRRHPKCPNNKSSKLPTRVLALQRSAPGAIISVRIEEDLESRTHYATLSHRWGLEQHCVTTLSNLVQRKTDIPWSSIPQTFKDAIQFSLTLGINYLWIDALCIVQDSPLDWQRESAKMADIYQNSYLTLAAAYSGSDTGGCFQNISRSAAEYSLNSPPDAPTSPSPMIKVREKVRHWDHLTEQQSKELYPLLTRGWVFQERILSPRTLHFCCQEMVWECNSETKCECGSIAASETPKEIFKVILDSKRLSQTKQGGSAAPLGILVANSDQNINDDYSKVTQEFVKALTPVTEADRKRSSSSGFNVSGSWFKSEHFST